MAKEVVIGSLGKLRRTDTYRFNGANSFRTGSVGTITSLSIDLKFGNTETTRDGILGISSADYSIWRYENTHSLGAKVPKLGGTVFDFPTITDCFPVEGWVSIKLLHDGNNLVISCGNDSVAVLDADPLHFYGDGIDLGRRWSFSNGIFEAKNLVVDNYKFLQKGDFGSLDVPSHPTGADGVADGATNWWRQDIDEQYANPDLFKSATPLPITEDYRLIYTDGEPYYSTDDLYWAGYNEDPTYNFEVVKQTKRALVAGARLTSLKTGLLF